MTNGERSERVVEPGPVFGDGEPVRIYIRQRERRIDLDDGGVAWTKAGASGREALEAAERVVAEEGFNVNRSGVVFVSVVEGRDLAGILLRLADCAERVQAALLDAA
jgi:hypothetical protein